MGIAMVEFIIVFGIDQIGQCVDIAADVTAQGGLYADLMILRSRT